MKKVEDFIVKIFSGESDIANKIGWLIVNSVVVVCFVCFMVAFIVLKP